MHSPKCSNVWMTWEEPQEGHVGGFRVFDSELTVIASKYAREADELSLVTRVGWQVHPHESGEFFAIRPVIVWDHVKTSRPETDDRAKSGKYCTI